jgi:hypothetical protein
LAWQIIVGVDREVMDNGLKANFVCFHCFAPDLFPLKRGGDSEQIHEGRLWNPSQAILVERSLPRTYDLRIGQEGRIALSLKSLHNLPKLSLAEDLAIPWYKGELW